MTGLCDHSLPVSDVEIRPMYFLEKRPIEENVHCGKEVVLFYLGDRSEAIWDVFG